MQEKGAWGLEIAQWLVMTGFETHFQGLAVTRPPD